MKKINLSWLGALLVLMLLSPTAMAQSLNFSEGELSKVTESHSTDSWVYFKPGVNWTAPEVLAQLGEEMHLDKADDFRLVREQADPKGATHLRYQQYHNDLPVEGGILLFHYKGGELSMLNGSWGKDLKVAAFNPLDGKEAEDWLGMAGPAVIAFDPSLKLTQEMLNKAKVEHVHPVITFAPFKQGEEINYVPAHKIEFEMDGLNYIAWVNATDGYLVKVATGFHTCTQVTSAVSPYNGTVTGPSMNNDFIGGLYQMTDQCRNIQTHVVAGGTGISQAIANNWATVHKDEVGAHWGASLAYDYFDNLGFTGLGGYPIKIYFAPGWPNAAYYFDELNQESVIYVGENTPGKFLNSLDIMGHEYAHGVTQFTAGLNYEYFTEASALNESYSDIFGALVEYEASVLHPSNVTFDWVAGGDVQTGGFRNASSPIIDSYLASGWGSMGAHDRSEVHSYWFYLLSDGGSGTNSAPSSYTYNVNGLGKTTAGEIAWRNLSVYLHPLSTFADARVGGIQSAIDLFGNCSFEVAETTEAYNAIGVYDQFNSSCGLTVCAEVVEETCSSVNGSIELTVYPAGGVHYQWSNGPVGNNISGIAAGVYTVTITNTTTSCSFTQTYSVGESTLDFRVSQYPTGPSGINRHEAIDIQHDNNGNTYLLGHFETELQWGPYSVQKLTAGNAIYLAKYTPCGSLDWLIYSESESMGIEMVEMAVDNVHSQIILIGEANRPGGIPLMKVDNSGTNVIGGINQNGTSGMAFSIGMSGTLNWSNGNLQYNDPYMGLIDFHAAGVEVDEMPQSAPMGQQSAVYLAGTIDKSVAGIVRLDALNGSSLWYHSLFGSIISNGIIFNALKDIEVERGYIFVGGYFNTYILLNGQFYYPHSSEDGIVVGYRDLNHNSPPNFLWLTQFSSNDKAKVEDLAFDNYNNVLYTVGTFRKDIFIGPLADWYASSVSLSPLPGADNHENGFLFKLNASDGLYKSQHPVPGNGQVIDQTGFLSIFGKHQGTAAFRNLEVIVGNSVPGTVEEIFVGGEVEAFSPFGLPAFDDDYNDANHFHQIQAGGYRYFTSRFSIDYTGTPLSTHGQTGLEMWTGGIGNTGMVHSYIRPNFFYDADSDMNAFGGLSQTGGRLYVHGTMHSDFVIPRLSIHEPYQGADQAFVVRQEVAKGIPYRLMVAPMAEVEEPTAAAELAGSWQVFPNPSNGNLQVQLDSDLYSPGASIRISDLSGRLVWEEQLSGPNHQLMLSGQLSTGTYLLSVNSENQSLLSQLIVIQ